MRVQLVDETGVTIGYAPKLDAHGGAGQLHRAVSVMVRRPTDGALLLQRRADSKYHFGGLWANSCCSHPYDRETPLEAARRALTIELGICAEPREVSTFIYRAEDEQSDLVEHEFDHVFVADWEHSAITNADEVSDVRWMQPEAIRSEIAAEPTRFVPWLRPVLRVLESNGCLAQPR